MQNTIQVVVSQQSAKPAPVELGFAELRHVTGGLGPNSTWAVGSNPQGPNGTWAVAQGPNSTW